MVPRLREFFRQGQAEVVSNSKNKSLATWEPFFLPGPVYFSLLSEIYPVWGFAKHVSTARRQDIWRRDSCNLLDRNKYALLSNTWFKCPSLNWVKLATLIHSKVNALPAVTAQNELRDIKLGACGRDSIYKRRPWTLVRNRVKSNFAEKLVRADTFLKKMMSCKRTVLFGVFHIWRSHWRGNTYGRVREYACILC